MHITKAALHDVNSSGFAHPNYSIPRLQCIAPPCSDEHHFFLFYLQQAAPASLVQLTFSRSTRLTSK